MIDRAEPTVPRTAAYPLVDVALARRLERTEACGNVAFVEARAALSPESGAGWREVAGTYAMFDGVGSPCTQTFGLGLFAAPTDADLAALEGFFAERGVADVRHEVSPLADPTLLALLPHRGYRPSELSSVLHCPIDALEAHRARPTEVRARTIEPGEASRWAAAAARGWSASPTLESFIEGLGLVSAHAHGTTCFIAEIGGEAVATGAMHVHDGVALLAGASTIGAWRRRGAQAALLEARVRYAASLGADLAMMAALPGSTSQQNAERLGFRIAYTRIKWERVPGQAR